jgi:hypothetical protein
MSAITVTAKFHPQKQLHRLPADHGLCSTSSLYSAAVIFLKYLPAGGRVLRKPPAVCF